MHDPQLIKFIFSLFVDIFLNFSITHIIDFVINWKWSWISRSNKKIRPNPIKSRMLFIVGKITSWDTLIQQYKHFEKSTCKIFTGHQQRHAWTKSLFNSYLKDRCISDSTYFTKPMQFFSFEVNYRWKTRISVRSI